MSRLPEDRLGHNQVVERLEKEVTALSRSSCIALYGTWGRGKTDVLSRLKARLDLDPNIGVVEANPWLSGYSSLLLAVAASLATYKPIDDHTKQSLKRVGKIAFMVANRFLLQRVSGADLEQFADDLVELAHADSASSPIQAAVSEIDSLALRCFEGKKVVVLVDDIDRCPPEWQRPILESLYFLKLCKSHIVFVCAIDQRSLAHIDMPYHGLDEAGSLCTKVFDLIHDLGAVQNELHEYGIDLLQRHDEVVGGSIVEQLRSIFGTWDNAVSPASIVNGMCSSRELATPRTIERAVARLKTIAFTVEPQKGMPCNSAYVAQGFGLALALRERFPNITTYLYSTLPNLLRSPAGSRPLDRRQIEQLRDSIRSLPMVQAETIVEAFSNAHVSLDPESPGNHTQGEMIKMGIEYAARLSRLAVV
jgi:hypothetical protein